MDLHVFFLPFLAPGHMIPMVDLAVLFADRGARATVVTTAGNAARIQPTLDRATSPITLLTVPFPSDESDTITALPTPDLTPSFISAISSLEPPFRRLIEAHRPDFLVSDVFYPWTVDLGVPRVAFHGSSTFATIIPAMIKRLKPHDNVHGDDEPFLVPTIPHRIELTRSRFPDFMTKKEDLLASQMQDSHSRSYGTVMNSFYELETYYADRFKAVSKVWYVGPFSLRHRDLAGWAARGEKAAVDSDVILTWLDGRETGSVLYVCFGSFGKFTSSQLHEIGSGLDKSGRPFIWVVGKNGWDLPEGFAGGKGLVIKGWAPQLVILNHRAVGGFMTHCGWNSCLEGIAAGLPMITWPLYAEQFFNEKLLSGVLGIGVEIGAKVCSAREEARTAVSCDAVREAVEGLMGGGEEAEGRRRRARGLAEEARRAVEEGGSSYTDMDRLVEDLLADAKKSRFESGVHNVKA